MSDAPHDERAAKLRDYADRLDDLATACMYDGVSIKGHRWDRTPVEVPVDRYWPDVAAVHLASTLSTLARLLRLEARRYEYEEDRR